MKVNYEKAIDAAQKVIAHNYVITPPVRIEELAANYGLSVFESDFTPDYAHVAGLIDMDDETIYVNKEDSPARKAYTIAHELGHFLMHKEILKKHPEKYDVLYRTPMGQESESTMEEEAACFAAYLLMPEALWREYQGEDPEFIARVFGVPIDLIGYRYHLISYA